MTITLTMNTQTGDAAVVAADEIQNLMEQLGFTSEICPNVEEVKQMIADIIVKHLENHTNAQVIS
jgi:hypothetical protein